MPENGWHLAQLNVARMLAPLEDPRMAEFTDNLEAINHLAETSPGFVWRLQTEEGDATSIQAFDDPQLLVNMSVWQSVGALNAFAYDSRHINFLRKRQQWFERSGQAYLVLWWIPAGHIPSVEEAKARLGRLRESGPGPEAFTFRKRFAPPSA